MSQSLSLWHLRGLERRRSRTWQPRRNFRRLGSLLRYGRRLRAPVLIALVSYGTCAAGPAAGGLITKRCRRVAGEYPGGLATCRSCDARAQLACGWSCLTCISLRTLRPVSLHGSCRVRLWVRSRSRAAATIVGSVTYVDAAAEERLSVATGWSEFADTAAAAEFGRFSPSSRRCCRMASLVHKTAPKMGAHRVAL